MRYFLLVLGVAVIAVMVVAGKRGDMSRLPPIELIPDMDRQPKLRPQAGNSFFHDGFSSQPQVAGTIARGSAYEDSPVNTGRIPGTTNWAPFIPVPVNAQLLARGRERYDINCTTCHGATGEGNGPVTKFGVSGVANLNDAAGKKIVQQPDGELFNTISHGKGLMGGYAANITIDDRWAIVAYVRALQRSRLGFIEDVPAGERGDLTKLLPPAAPKN